MKHGWRSVWIVLPVLAGGCTVCASLDHHRIPDIHTYRTFYLKEGDRDAGRNDL